MLISGYLCLIVTSMKYVLVHQRSSALIRKWLELCLRRRWHLIRPTEACKWIELAFSAQIQLLRLAFFCRITWTLDSIETKRRGAEQPDAWSLAPVCCLHRLWPILFRMKQTWHLGLYLSGCTCFREDGWRTKAVWGPCSIGCLKLRDG